MQEQERYGYLWKKLFSVNGLADKNKDGFISYDEQFDAWDRMGLVDSTKSYFESNSSSNSSRDFPTPKAKNLEKAIRDYEIER